MSSGPAPSAQRVRCVPDRGLPAASRVPFPSSARSARSARSAGSARPPPRGPGIPRLTHPLPAIPATAPQPRPQEDLTRGRGPAPSSHRTLQIQTRGRGPGLTGAGDRALRSRREGAQRAGAPGAGRRVPRSGRWAQRRAEPKTSCQPGSASVLAPRSTPLRSPRCQQQASGCPGGRSLGARTAQDRWGLSAGPGGAPRPPAELPPPVPAPPEPGDPAPGVRALHPSLKGAGRPRC